MNKLITRQYVLNTNSNNPIGCSICTECGAKVRVRLRPYCLIESVSKDSNHYSQCTQSGDWIYMYTPQEEQEWESEFQEKGVINNELSWFFLGKAIRQKKITKQEVLNKTLAYIGSKNKDLALKLEPQIKELLEVLGNGN